MDVLRSLFGLILLLIILKIFGWCVAQVMNRMDIKRTPKSYVLVSISLIIMAYASVAFFPNDSEVDNVNTEEMSFVEISTVSEEIEGTVTTEFSSSEDIEPESEISSSEDTEELDLDNNDTDIEKNEIESEEEYKAKCITLYHDDVFFSDNDLEGTDVRLELFVEEKYYFKSDAAFDYSFREFNDKYDLKKNFFKCGVKRDVDSVSYVGGQLNLYFSNNYELQSTDIMLGDHVVVYGEVVVFSTNTMSGYNSVSIIPHYIENNGQ